MKRSDNRVHHRGLSLLELMGVITLLGILVMLIVPRFSGSSAEAKATSCDVNRRNIELQSQLWFRNKGAWPDSSLSDIMADPVYFPDGTVTCPFDGSSYTFDAATQKVTGHAH